MLDPSTFSQRNNSIPLIRLPPELLASIFQTQTLEGPDRLALALTCKYLASFTNVHRDLAKYTHTTKWKGYYPSRPRCDQAVFLRRLQTKPDEQLCDVCVKYRSTKRNVRWRLGAAGDLCRDILVSKWIEHSKLDVLKICPECCVKYELYGHILEKGEDPRNRAGNRH